MNDEGSKHKELIMDEFLLKTIVSLQVTLATLSKDSEQKTDLLHEVTDSLTAIAYNMKDVRDKIEKKDINLRDYISNIDTLNRKLELLEVKLERDNNQVEEHIKEIKYSVQQLASSLIELKTEKKVNDKQEASEKKLDISELFNKVWESIKNVRTIFYVILAIILIISAAVSGQGFIPELLNIIKNLIGA